MLSRTRIAFASLALVALATLGCKSQHEEGVKTDFMRNWVTVGANTVATTDAAKAVLADEGLRDVTASSTNVDGTASAMQADGTKVNVTVTKVNDMSSTVTVKVGSLGIGNGKLSSEIAAKIKARAEGMKPM